MVISTSRLAYGDCFDLMDQAIESKKGTRVLCNDRDSAIFLRMRIHNARKIDRNDNLKEYPEESPLYGRSIYDELMATIRDDTDGQSWLYLEKINTRTFHVEEIEDNGNDQSAASDNGPTEGITQ
jgi:hypothetical protein